MLQPETASLASGRPCPDRSRARISGKTALKVIASSIRKGNVIEQDGKLYVVLTAENIHPGKGTPVSQIEMRRISDGVKISERYKTTDQVEKATIEDHNFNYLYEDADGFHFMNNENYDQVQVPKDVVGTAAPYLQENMTVKLSLHGVIPVAIQMPQRATLEVVETEPVTKGQTASSSYKPAILSNGVRTAVPPHIGTGHADRGHDRGRLLRRARQGLGITGSGDHPGMLEGATQLMRSCPAPRSVRRAVAGIFRPAARRHGRLRPPTNSGRPRFRRSASIGAPCSTSSAPRSARQPAVAVRLHVFRPAPAARLRSAVDAGAGATERRDLADLQRHRAQPGAGAAAVRYRGLSRRAVEAARRPASAVALSGRLPSRRPVRRRARRLRRGVFARARRRQRHAAANLRQTGRSADHRLDPDLRHQRSRSAARASRSSRWPRNFPTCAASSGKAMCVTPSRASACPMWCRSSASTQPPARGGWPAARPIRSPSVS